MGRKRTGGLALLAVAVLAASVLVGCDPAEKARPADGRIEVLAAWSGLEQRRFTRVLDDFRRRSGVTVAYTSAGHGVPDALEARLKRGALPDVAVLPQPGLLRDFAARGLLVPLDAPTRALVASAFPRTLRDLATYRGRSYGVWFKAADKSLVWYDVGTFERVGAVPARTVAGLVRLARQVQRGGTPALAVAGGDAWTLTDLFENLFLRIGGPHAYDLLAAHRIPWTSPSVLRTLRTMDALLSAGGVMGGRDRAARLPFQAAVTAAFQAPAQAAMLVEGDFVAGAVAAGAKAGVGVDVDVFAFPPLTRAPDPAIVGGGDVAVLLRPTPAGRAFLRYLATPEAAAVWAAQGGFLSPNLELDVGVYPDVVSRTIAREVLAAGDDFHFDLSDLAPPAFGGSESRGMRVELRRFLRDCDVIATARRLEAEATTAYSAVPS